jgi:hypothetical protein
MKNYIKIFFIFFMLLYFVRCNYIKHSNITGMQKIVLTENTSVNRQTDLMKDIKYVQLQTSDDCLINEVTEMYCTSREIFIFDIFTQSVYVFDYSGRYLRKLHKVGQGPGEYSMMSSVSVNEKTKRLSIVDLGKCVMYYDINSFDYLGEQKIDAVSIEEVEEGKYVAFNSLPVTKDDVKYNCFVLKYGVKGNIERQYVPIDFASGYLMRPAHRFYTFDNDLYFYPPFTSQVYKITKDSCTVCYDIQYDNLSYPPIDFLNLTDKRGENYIKKLFDEHYVYLSQIFETHNLLVSTFNVGRRCYLGLYDKKKNNGFYVFRKEYNKTGNGIDYFQISGVHNDEFISVLKSSEIKQNTALIDNALKKLVSNTAEDSNPVICMFKF